MREFCQEAIYRPGMEGAKKSLRKARQNYKKRTKTKKISFKFCLPGYQERLSVFLTI